MAPRIALYDFAPSPFCVKVRALLEHKGLAYTRRSVMKPQVYLELRRRSPTGQVPALDIDGELVIDSSAIAERLERERPSPPLRPAGPGDAALGAIVEDWADESLYFYGLYYRWADPRGVADAGRAFPGPARPALRFGLRRQAMARLRAQGIGRKPSEMVARELRALLAHADGLLGDRPFVLGRDPYLCDFALASQLLFVRRTPTAAPMVDAHPRLVAYLERFRALRSGS